MADRITGPSVLTRLKIGGFTLNVYAYRVLTKQESMRAVALYMQQKTYKSFAVSRFSQSFYAIRK